MKKLLIFLLLILLSTGCMKDVNKPSDEVKKLFLNYNSLNSELLIQLDSVIDTEDLTESQKFKYKEILKKQYEDLKYTINAENISGDKAIVNVKLEVYNLSNSFKNANEYLENNQEEFYSDGIFNSEKFWDYKLNIMKDEKERIEYTLDLSLTKIDGKWHLDELLESDRQKIHGLYT